MKIINLVLIIIIAFLAFRVAYLDRQNTALKGEAAELSEKLKSQVVVTKEKIVYKYRDNAGNAKQETIYVPSEGQVEIITPKEEETIKPSHVDTFFNTYIEQTDGSIIKVQNKGLALAPEVGILYTDKLEVALQLRLAYWNRYNAGIGFSNEQTAFAYVSRHLSDIFNFLQNTSIQIGIGKNFKEQDTKFGIGLVTRL